MCGLIIDWKSALFTLTTIVAIVSVLFSFLRLTACLTPLPPPIRPRIRRDDLPPYTVLVPLYNEANMIPSIIAALDRLDYPRDRLQIFLICEDVDPKTVEAVQRNLRAPFELIITPKGKPQTKPRALNYAMQYAAGQLVTIFDAEDRPAPQQLIIAANAFAQNPDWQALQAPLNYYNSDQNWLTRQFALEYAALFHVWVPFLAKLGLPFPLGGTSNHMRASILAQTGGWDAHNVTEDADLSFRIAALGGKIGYIRTGTDEEAVADMRDWHFQRARWIKGFFQSWGVHMRVPFLPSGKAGLARFFTLQITLGLTLLAIAFYTPSMIILAVYLGFCALSGSAAQIPLIYSACFVFSLAAGVLITCVGTVRAGKAQLIKSAICVPAYWDAEDAWRDCNKTARELGLSPTQFSLKFVESREFVTSNIIGATTMTQLKENIDAHDITWTKDMEKQAHRLHKTYRCPAGR